MDKFQVTVEKDGFVSSKPWVVRIKNLTSGGGSVVGPYRTKKAATDARRCYLMCPSLIK
jgi:hypothetical protein